MSSEWSEWSETRPESRRETRDVGRQREGVESASLDTRIKDATERAKDAAREAAMRAAEGARRAGDTAAKAGKAAGVTAAVVYHAMEPAGGLAPRQPEFGPAQRDVASTQRAETQGGSARERVVDGVDIALDTKQHAEDAKERVGITDDVDRLADWKEKRDEDLRDEARRDHGKPNSSLHDDPPDDFRTHREHT